jgi:hypothetical protein
MTKVNVSMFITTGISEVGLLEEDGGDEEA